MNDTAAADLFSIEKYKLFQQIENIFVWFNLWTLFYIAYDVAHVLSDISSLHHHHHDCFHQFCCRMSTPELLQCTVDMFVRKCVCFICVC